jgi:hypothetical protein
VFEASSSPFVQINLASIIFKLTGAHNLTNLVVSDVACSDDVHNHSPSLPISVLQSALDKHLPFGVPLLSNIYN